MKTLRAIEKKGSEAVRKLRIQKLRNGQPFMINSPELLTNQCYLEYPDGIIRLVTIKKAARVFHIIRDLTPAESNSLRRKYKLSD